MNYALLASAFILGGLLTFLITGLVQRGGAQWQGRRRHRQTLQRLQRDFPAGK